MKKIYSQIAFACLAVLTMLVACEEEVVSHTEVTPVRSLYAPDDNAYMNLGAQSSAVFEWEAARAADNGVVLYEVVFDTEEGDFSDPVYMTPSDGNGFQRTLNISFAELSRIAGMAGIQPAETGKLKWTVYSSKGINVQQTDVFRVIEVERPAGFPAPDELFIAGSATEAGDNISEAIPMKKRSANIFEVYTSLAEGEYYFAERNTGTPATYFIDNGDLKAGGTTEVTGEEKVYRIRVDFSNATAEIVEIESVGLWFAPNDEFMFELPYVGNGIWEIQDAPVEFRQEGWGRDERYKFRFTIVNEDGSTEDEWFGSTNADNQRPTASTGEAYWHMVPVSDDRWNNTFKFADEVDNNENDIRVIFNASVPAYTHSVTPN